MLPKFVGQHFIISHLLVAIKSRGFHYEGLNHFKSYLPIASAKEEHLLRFMVRKLILIHLHLPDI